MIGFYVHHHGRGHLARTTAILDRLDVDAMVMTSLPDVPDQISGARVIRLPPDAAAGAREGDPTARGSLHWAPERSFRLRRRAQTMANVLADAELSLLVVDVSVEAVLLARLFGVPSVSVRSHGDRTDRAHRLGYDASYRLLAPFPALLESEDTSDDIRERSFYAGFVSGGQPVGDRRTARHKLGIEDHTPVLLVVIGAGGHSFDPRQLLSICEALPGWTVVFAGSTTDGIAHERLRLPGWSNDLGRWMSACDVVAGHAGANLVAEVAACGRPFVCVPEDRPFNEQRSRAVRLAQLDAAIVLDGWPRPADWLSVVEKSLRLGSATLSALSRKDGAAASAEWLTTLHDEGLAGPVA